MEDRSDGASVVLPADINQVDETGWVWAFLSAAPDVARIARGSVIVAGDSAEPFLARVIDIVTGPGDQQIVHLDVIGVPDAR